MNSILQQVREAATKAVLFLPHALERMNEPDEMISPDEIRAVVFGGLVIEDHPDDSEAIVVSSWARAMGDGLSMSSARPSKITWRSSPPICPIRCVGRWIGEHGRGDEYGVPIL